MLVNLELYVRTCVGALESQLTLSQSVDGSSYICSSVEGGGSGCGPTRLGTLYTTLEAAEVSRVGDNSLPLGAL